MVRKVITSLIRELTFSYKSTFTWLTPSTYIAMNFLAPLVNMAFFSFLVGFFEGPVALRDAALGNAVLMVGVNAVSGITISIGIERETGNLAALLVTPASRFYLFAGRSLMHILEGMFSIVVGTLYAVLFFGVSLGKADVLSIVVVILLTSFCVAGYGFLLGGYALLARQTGAVFNVAFFSLTLLSGANFPISKLPIWLQPLSSIIPLTYGIEAFRMAVSGATVPEILPVLGLEVITGGALFITGYLLFRYFEMLVRRKGTFE